LSSSSFGESTSALPPPSTRSLVFTLSLRLLIAASISACTAGWVNPEAIFTAA
jgi:hypothetical protein